MPEEHDVPHDPLHLGSIDRDIRINELTERVKELGDGAETLHVSDDCPPEVHEQFLRQIIAYETGPFISHFERLERDGVALPHPETLDDAELTSKLWEVINALAAQRTYLYHTDHLSDRELYEELWHAVLREEMPLVPPSSTFECMIDLVSSGSDEDIENSLRYYDTEETRQHWARDFPGDPIPLHEDPPYDRDSRLPRSSDPAFGP
jgi:hypothetical protein